MARPSTSEDLPTKEMYDTIVDVIVGEGNDQKMFKLHKGILCFYSGYFDKALNGDFEEARKGVVKLPTENVDIFTCFVKWLYRGLLDYTFAKLPQFWVFADRRQIPLLANTCVQLLHREIASNWQVPTDLHFIYDNTTPDSALRRFVIKAIASASGPEAVMRDEDRGRWPADALWDLVKVTWMQDNTKELDIKEFEKMDTCQFHQHEEGVTCNPKTSTVRHSI